MTKDDMEAIGYRGTFGDCYRYMQKYGMDPQIDWDAAAQEANAISNKYKNTRAAQFCADMLSAIYEELNRGLNDGLALG